MQKEEFSFNDFLNMQKTNENVWFYGSNLGNDSWYKSKTSR